MSPPLNPPFTAVVRKVRRLESVSYRVAGLWKLVSHKLSEECLRHGSIEDFKALLREESPILRVLGLICLAKSVRPEEFLTIAKPLYVDRAPVRITNGCVLNRSVTVGAIAEQLAGDRFFLAAEDKSPATQILFYRSPKGVHDNDYTKQSLWVMGADGSSPR